MSTNQQEIAGEQTDDINEGLNETPLARLICTDPIVDSDLDGLEITLIDQEQSIGRATDNTVVIDYMRVSRYHARVFKKDGAWIVEDLTSTNGLYINNERVNKTTLNHGDQLLIASIPFRYELSYNQEQETDNNAYERVVEPDVVRTKLNQSPEATIVMSGSSYAEMPDPTVTTPVKKRSRLGVIVAISLVIILLAIVLAAVLI